MRPHPVQRKSISTPLANLINRGSFHGDDLVYQLASQPGTSGDASWYAEGTLLRAEELGLIERGKYDPSKQQRFSGLGGVPGDRLASLKDPHRSPVAFHWITKTTKYLEDGDLDILWFKPGQG